MLRVVQLQGCGNTEMFYLSPGKLSEKSYLCGQNPTCSVFLYKHLILVNTVAKLNLFILSITSLCKIWNIVLIKLTQTSLKWSLPKWRPFQIRISDKNVQSENSRLLLDTEYAVLKNIIISIKFILNLTNLGNGFIHQTNHVFRFSGVFMLRFDFFLLVGW